ncbi:hypothetical protein CFP65_5755 [Kitasatospora sp. MMS16-BH015]|uniref:acyl-CoA carboxylase epsilon subunit n=1 Tax=Kitasatospora sp. MMS16-BH015 TaxID=2018025 RepID=UPI000CA13108|nr:acyl-CoA carboxylase epsilon subunit [Kitasatospora sp. MMS16-BH015]AUG80441.1 hypothetical protein CFP65_5755 [Kitasatospora sp. MMS16-BH015]
MGLRVTRGCPTDAELAAVVVALAVVAGGQGAAGRGAAAGGGGVPRSDRSERLRRAPELRGPGAWRASGWR